VIDLVLVLGCLSWVWFGSMLLLPTSSILLNCSAYAKSDEKEQKVVKHIIRNVNIENFYSSEETHIKWAVDDAKINKK